jgi:hypothetical protein
MHPFCNLQNRARTHAILVIGLYELLGNPTTLLIEPPGPLLFIFPNQAIVEQLYLCFFIILLWLYLIGMVIIWAP